MTTDHVHIGATNILYSSTLVEEMSEVQTALNQVSAVTPAELRPYLQEFYALYEQRLWHELSDKTQAFFREPAAKPALVTLFKAFVLPWHRRMNQFVYVKLAIAASREMARNEAIALLDAVAEEMSQLKDAAQATPLRVLATMETAHYRLRNGDLEGVKRAIDSCSTAVDSFSGVDPAVSSAFFRVSADYDKAKADFGAFYRHTLLFLAGVKLEELSMEERRERAHDLCVAALLGEAIYNFGELLSHPILESLRGTPLSWLIDLTTAFNVGDHSTFERLLSSIQAHPSFGSRLDSLRKKLCLMSFVETAFRQLKIDRRLSFDQIAQATHVPPKQVEFLVMKAVALKLVRGTMSEPEKVFIIDWVHPRVLDRSQLEALREGIHLWRLKVVQTSQLIHSLLPEQISSII